MASTITAGEPEIADEPASSVQVPTILPTSGVPEPTGRSPEEERLYRKQRLAVSFRIFARHGFDMGPSGHISARDPIRPDCFWVNPMTLHFGLVRVSDLLLVDEAGSVIEGDGIVNLAAFMIHSKIHAARPDVVAAAHTHSLYGKIWSSMADPLELQPLSQDSVIFHDDCVVFDSYSGLVHDEDEGAQLAAALGEKHAMILRNHGILTAGQSVESAVWRYLALENACKVELLVRQAGGGRPMPESVAQSTHLQVGSEGAGIYSFEPYWKLIVSEQPEVLS